MTHRRQLALYFFVGIILGYLCAWPVFSYLAQRREFARRAEAERVAYCEVWQSENIEACLKGELK